ncbi:MAG: hypothetical protein CVU63_03165, partial [Deltaproteobacteria bacterium HGW-Deltaproteobacteria-20]
TPSEHTQDRDGDGIWDVCDPDGIPPILPGESAMRPRTGPTRLAARRAILAKLASDGVLDAETVSLALRAA